PRRPQRGQERPTRAAIPRPAIDITRPSATHTDPAMAMLRNSPLSGSPARIWAAARYTTDATIRSPPRRTRALAIRDLPPARAGGRPGRRAAPVLHGPCPGSFSGPGAPRTGARSDPG